MQKTLRILGSACLQGLWQHGRGGSGNIDVGLVVAWLMDSSFQILVLKKDSLNRFYLVLVFKFSWRQFMVALEC